MYSNTDEKGAWHFLPSEHYNEQQLRTQDNVNQEVFDHALADEKYETMVYFHGNALNRAASWRVDLYKVGNWSYTTHRTRELMLDLANFKSIWKSEYCGD